MSLTLPPFDFIAVQTVLYALYNLGDELYNSPHPEGVEIPGMFHDLPLREMSSFEELVHWNGRRLRLPVPAQP